MTTSPIVNNTPVEQHDLHGRRVWVKREDLCAPYPGPAFSKTRGVWAHIAAREEPVIGVLDTLHSKAGWCVSYLGALQHKKVVNYWPRFKADPPLGLVRPQQIEAHNQGATMVAVKAGRSAILYHTAKKHLREAYGADGYLMPNALKLPESITENAAEAERTAEHLPRDAVLVISISSGTVASGVLKGLASAGLLGNYRVVLHMGYSRPEEAARAYIETMSGLKLNPELVQIVDESYGYADTAPKGSSAPFPCNPHYDLKAWNWLSKVMIYATDKAPFEGRPVVFWNIGA